MFFTKTFIFSTLVALTALPSSIAKKSSVYKGDGVNLKVYNKDSRSNCNPTKRKCYQDLASFDCWTPKTNFIIKSEIDPSNSSGPGGTWRAAIKYPLGVTFFGQYVGAEGYNYAPGNIVNDTFSDSTSVVTFKPDFAPSSHSPRFQVYSADGQQGPYYDREFPSTGKKCIPGI